MLRRASATAVFAMLLLPALAASSSKVLLSGETLHQRSLPEFVVLPDFSLLQLAKIRFLCPGARPDETLVYDLGGGSVERYRGQTPSAVLERKSYRIPYLSIRDAELPIFYAPNAEDLASDNTVDQPGVLVFVGDRPYFTRPRPVPKAGPGSTTSTTTATTAPSSTITTTPSSTTTTTTTAFACTTARCSFDSAHASSACAGQTIPASLTRKFTKAESLIDDAASNPEQSRKLLRRARRVLRNTATTATKLAKPKRAKLSKACAGALADAARHVAAGL